MWRWDDARQREQDRVHQPDDGQGEADQANRQLMRRAVDRLLDAALQPLDRAIEVGLAGELRQDMADQRLCMRFGGMALDPRGFESLRIGQRIDRHRTTRRSVLCAPLCACGYYYISSGSFFAKKQGPGGVSDIGC